MEQENLQEKIKKFKETRKVRNQKYYMQHIDDRREKARNRYVYDGTKITCETCNCEINKKSYLQHCLSDKHNNNINKNKQ